MENNWQEENGQLTKEFQFENFVEAVGFVNKVAVHAEEANHHPDVTIHSYNKVKLNLMTHSEGMITDKDHALAAVIDAL